MVVLIALCFGVELCLPHPPPPDRVGRHIVFPRASVCPSVRPSVRLSVRHKSCPLYNLKTVKDFSMKLGKLVNHDETKCHAQDRAITLA